MIKPQKLIYSLRLLRDDIRKRLELSARAAPVPLFHFAKDCDISIEALGQLQREINESLKERSIPDCLALHCDLNADVSSSASSAWLISDAYYGMLQDDIQSRVTAAYEEAQPLALDPDRLPGKPPLFLLIRMEERSHDKYPGERLIHDGILEYIPQTVLSREIDRTLEQLASGTTNFYNISQITERLPQKYTQLSDVQSMIRNLYPEQVLVFEEMAVSKSWFDKHVELELDRVTKTPLIDLQERIVVPSEASEKALSGILGAIKAAVSDAAPMEVEYIPHEGAWLAAQADWLDQLDSLIAGRAVQQAQKKWNQLTPDSDVELALDPADLLETLKAGQALASSAQDFIKGKIDETGKAAFDTEISRLSAESLETFSALWRDRVDTRFQLYRLGADAIPDAKLREQLLELLQTHIRAELIPETLSRAEAQGLLRGKKLKKSVEKLKASLELDGKDTTLTSTLNKFANKLSPSTTSLADAKTAHLIDLHQTIRALDRDKDGPRLFLALIVVLLAKYQDGVVYATGKFAPKLMRLLKGRVSEEVYGRLERLKEGVKSGKAGREEREEIKELAAADGADA